MEDKSFDKILQEFFPKSSKKDWVKMAALETQKKNPIETLSWHGKDDILFLPYYDPENLAGLDHLKAFHRSSDPSPRPWKNLPAVHVSNERTANHNSLNHLALGADGVLFDLTPSAQTDLHALLQGILLPRVFLALRLNANTLILNALSDFIQRESQPALVSGALFWESIPKEGNWDYFLNAHKNFKGLGLIIPAAPPAQLVCQALLEGVKTFERLAEKSDPEKVFNSISFSVAADASLLEAVAGLRALRMLWLQVGRAYSQNNYNPADLHLHAHSVAAVDARYAPRENMLKGTYAAMAAILGGCDSLTVGDDGTSAVASRWSTNVANIFRYESFFDRIADAAAGAFAIESMTDSIAEKAWTLFQQKSRAR
ncbi:MAG TPA: methylmalonyl-CoA mutase family protein [Chryseosolibacter sp.]